MLLLVVPVSLSDHLLLEQWVSAFRAVGGAPRCHILFVPSALLQTKARQASNAIAGLCLSSTVIPLEREPAGGWPRAANEHHFWAMLTRLKLPTHLRTMPFIWMELDALPSRARWDDEIYSGYMLEAGGHGFYGHIRPMVRDVAPVVKGVPLDQHKPVWITDEADLYMEGVCVYPGNYDQMVDGQYRGMDTRAAWDQRLRHYFKKDWHKTDLFEHHWRTVNYREVDGQIVCEDGPDNLYGTKHGGSVSNRAAIIHGCKDDSLAKIILARNNAEMISLDDYTAAKPVAVAVAEVATKKAGVPINQAQFTPVVPPTERTTSGGSDNAMAAQLAQLKAARENTEAVAASSKPVEIETIRGIVNAKKMRLDELAKAVKITKENLRKLIEQSGSGMKISKGGLAWVSIAA